MEIVTYPLDGYRYDAADAAGYFSTRQSGVYSAAEDFAVTVDGSTSVTVSAGRAWMHPDRWTGYSIICRENQTVKLPAADGTRTRIDRIVLRYDAAARKTSLLVLEGTPDSSSPAAPAITRTALVYDLCLAEIRRTAGSTAVTSADITDTRTDEDVCGIMRDDVTGIPTAQLLEQWQGCLPLRRPRWRAAAFIQNLRWTHSLSPTACLQPPAPLWAASRWAITSALTHPAGCPVPHPTLCLLLPRPPWAA